MEKWGKSVLALLGTFLFFEIGTEMIWLLFSSMICNRKKESAETTILAF